MITVQDRLLIAVIGYAYRMELRWLTTFVAVAEELSYRRAAARLLVAQPAVSQQIMNL